MEKIITALGEVEMTNIHIMMKELSINSYDKFWRWSVQNKYTFWEKTIEKLGIVFDEKYNSIVKVTNGVENAEWLYGAKYNIIDSCFQADKDAIAIVYDKENSLEKVTYQELEVKVNTIANGLVSKGVLVGDTVAIYMSMSVAAVAIYLAAIKTGCIVATIADSFSVDEITVRLKITKPKIIFTQESYTRAGKNHLLYQKSLEAGAHNCVVVEDELKKTFLKFGDVFFKDFLSSNISFTSVKVSPHHRSTILFSSGTTGEPKAIPWSHITPIKSASEAYYHHDIKEGNVLCWPTNLGWMMGPWLVFASLINKGTIALYSGSPLENKFGEFVQNTQVSMLGVVPSIVKAWKLSRNMEGFDWREIRCFSSTGEVSNPEEMSYLMSLANHKPVIEYCGGTEIGGGYIASTLVQENKPSQFSTQTLGGEFVLLNDKGEKDELGEVFLIPPILGLSTELLNRSHHDVYYKDVPKYKGNTLRKHGDEFLYLENGFYKANGRVDDTMNLGGIKVSSVQIEVVVNTLDFVKESAAIAVSSKNGGPSELVVYFVGSETELENEALKKVQNLIKSKLNPLFKVIDLVKIDNLPRTASKKLKRTELRNFYQT